MELGFTSPMVVQVTLLHTLDGIVGSRSGVDGSIDDAEGPRTQDCLDPECTVIDGLAKELGCERRIGPGRNSGGGSKDSDVN